MTLHVAPLSPVAAPAGATGPGEPTTGVATPVRADATAAAAPAQHEATADVIPASPPAEVAAELAAAQARAEELAAANRELHFSKDPGSNRIIVEVRDLEGNVLRTIPPSEALAVMAGERTV